MYTGFLDQVLELYKNGDWKGVMNLNEQSDIDEALKLLWIWPSEGNLKFIRDILQLYHKKGIISLGCGCGLFEWILQCYTKKEVIGYEVNKEWWGSRYSNPQFIQLTFPDFPLEHNLNAKYVLLFCYFNNRAAFEDYVDRYDGDLIIIIGPGPNKGHHTDPQPFQPGFRTTDWTLLRYQEVKQTKDFIAVYIRTKDVVA